MTHVESRAAVTRMRLPIGVKLLIALCLSLGLWAAIIMALAWLADRAA